MIKKFKKRYIVIIVILAIAGYAGYKLMSKKPKTEYVTAKVEKGKLIQTVSETGTVKSVSDFDLNFGASGKIAKLSAKVGDQVKAGQALAELDHAQLDLKVKEAQSAVVSAQANLAKVRTGATTQTVAVGQAGVKQAQASYDAAVKDLEKIKKSVATSIVQAEKNVRDLEKGQGDVTSSEQAVNVAQTSLTNTRSSNQRALDNAQNNALNNVDSKFASMSAALDYVNKILNDSDAKYMLSIQDVSYLNKTKTTYDESKSLLKIAVDSQNKAKASKTEDAVNNSLNDTEAALNKTGDTLDNCFNALKNSLAGSSFTQLTLDTYKSTVNNHISIINTAITSIQSSSQSMSDASLNYNNNVSAAERNLAQTQTNWDNAKNNARNTLDTAKVSGDQQISSAQSRLESAQKALDVARAQLDQTEAPARSQDVTVARSQVDQAVSALNSVKKQVDDAIIKAPVEGVITKSNYEIGEQSSPSKAVFSMLGDHKFEIDVDVSEADIAKVNINDKTEITFDAYGEDVKFKGKVFFIDPAETVIQDVVYYKVKIDFDEKKYKIKSGMTANVVITTNEKDGIYKIPNRAIIETEGKKVVKVLKNNNITEVEVKVGLRGDEGIVELISGPAEGEEVVLSTKEVN